MGPDPPPPVVAADDDAGLVRALAARTGSLYGVPETARVIVLDAVERTGAAAGALLVPDGERWLVAAGVGLRPREHSYALTRASWLVSQVAESWTGALIEDSDAARAQLQGAPLASWRQLLAAPVPEVKALLLLAREDPPFREEELLTLAEQSAEAGRLLAAAIATRSLARALAEFRDLPQASA